MLRLACILLLSLLALSAKRFAMNKPHMLFQVSSRQPQSINVGWGYWHDSHNGTYSELRLKYQNTKHGLYCHMTEHDGESHFKEQVEDRTYGLNSTIRYQNVDNWQADILMGRPSDEGSIYSFVYFAIENNDYDKVDKVGYHSQRKLLVQRTEKGVKIIVKQHGVQEEEFYLSASSKVDVFGMYANVSETWNTYNLMKEFQEIKQVHQYPKTTRTSDSKRKSWQDKQLQYVKEDNWYNSEFVIIVAYVRFSKEERITLKMQQDGPFDHDRFEQDSAKLKQLYSGEDKQELLQHVLFNLLGGIAHYYGPLYAQNSLLKQEQTVTHSTTPSRLIFPRCFLWDDGFQLTVLADKHPDLSLRFLKQWFEKIDLFGWIAREQIRGYEVSAMMPDLTFVYQDSLEGNPPTLMLPLRYMIDKQPENEQLRKLLKSSMWKLEKWFRYFKTTQSHFDLTDDQQIVQDVKFRWRCKDSCKNGNFMGSGLDDYPRQDTKQLSKQHVDLISWLYFFAESLGKVSEYLNNTKGMKYYQNLTQFYNNSLHKSYYDSKDSLFKDISVSEAQNIDGFVTHIGYINLFPFMMGMVHEGSPAFLKIMEVMQSPQHLWSPGGIRSLSKSDPLYGTGDNYWRGSVWMPINYMILRACKLYYPNSTKEFHDRLRQTLIETIERGYRQEGYLFENYNEGQGNRGYPFYGWTSLINPIILDLY